MRRGGDRDRPADRQRFLDAQPCAPEHHNQPAEPAAVHVVTGGAHDADDLLGLRRVGRVCRSRRLLLRAVGDGKQQGAAARTFRISSRRDASAPPDPGLEAWQDTRSIEFAPLTVLFGSNSSEIRASTIS